MAFGQGAIKAPSNLVEPNLNDVIISSSAKRRTDPRNTLVNVDYSNVNGWEIYQPVAGQVESKQRVSIKSLADSLQHNENVAEARIFMPRTELDARTVDPVTDWVMSNYSDLFNSKDFNCNDDAFTYGVKLGLALDKFFYRMLDSKQRGEIQDHTREQIQTVIRGAFFANSAAMFNERDCKVFTKTEVTRDKTLLDDRTHRKVVSKMRSLMNATEHLVDRMAANLSMLKEDNANKAKMEEDLWEMQRNLIKMRYTIEKEISQYRKCDLDAYIVAKSLAPDTVSKFDNQVFFSGDADFEELYKELAEAGVNIIVVSPDLYLSRTIVNLEVQGVLTTHRPDFVDDIWRTAYVP